HPSDRRLLEGTGWFSVFRKAACPCLASRGAACCALLSDLSAAEARRGRGRRQCLTPFYLFISFPTCCAFSHFVSGFGTNSTLSGQIIPYASWNHFVFHPPFSECARAATYEYKSATSSNLGLGSLLTLGVNSGGSTAGPRSTKPERVEFACLR